MINGKMFRPLITLDWDVSKQLFLYVHLFCFKLYIYFSYLFKQTLTTKDLLL